VLRDLGGCYEGLVIEFVVMKLVLHLFSGILLKKLFSYLLIVNNIDFIPIFREHDIGPTFPESIINFFMIIIDLDGWKDRYILKISVIMD
jgi:hypothetical protein